MNIRDSLATKYSSSMSISETISFAPVTHVIFDLDGTIIDTVSAYSEALNNVVAMFDKSVTPKMMPIILSASSAAGGIEALIKYLGIDISVEDFIQHYELYLDKALAKVNLMPGVLRLLDHLKDNKIPIGLCTAVSKQRFKLKTEHLNELYGLYNYFEVIVTAKSDPDVKDNKPSPDPYLVAINRFETKANPENVLVFEDTIAGIKSATTAGTQCVMIYDNRRYISPFSMVSQVITSWSEFKPEMFGLPYFENSHETCTTRL